VYTYGAKDDAAMNVVVPLAKSLACTLVISTYESVKKSGTEWYKNQFKATVDGDTTNNAVKFSSFIGVPHAFPSLGQKTGNAAYTQEKKDVVTSMWLFMSIFDIGVSTLNRRLFPWDSSGSAGKSGKTTASLHIRNYGSGLKSAATFTGAITGSLFNDAGNSLFGKKGLTMNYAAASTDAKLDSDTKTGYLSMTYLKETWGGTCCKGGYDACVKAGL